jgi:hypothetical protein
MNCPYFNLRINPGFDYKESFKSWGWTDGFKTIKIRLSMNNHSILNSNILGQIENYAIEHDGLSLKLLGFTDEITVNAYAFPSSFDDEETQSQLKKLVEVHGAKAEEKGEFHQHEKKKQIQPKNQEYYALAN